MSSIIHIGAIIAAAMPLPPPGLAQDQPAPHQSTPPPSNVTEVTEDDVEYAIRRALDFLWSQQRRDGKWISPEFEHLFPNALTALTAYTVHAAGTPPGDHRLQLAARKLVDCTDVNTVYARSFILMLWCALGGGEFDRLIEEDIRFLKIQQNESGGWGYGRLTDVGPGKRWSDNAHSQLALLALHQAAEHGARVNANIWRRAEQSWLENVNPDGGWGYPLGENPEFADRPSQSIGSMTAAGLASLHIIYDHLYLDAGLPFNGRFVAGCGTDVEETRPIRQAMEGAWRWLVDRYQVGAVPGWMPDASPNPIRDNLTHYLFCLDRVGVASGRRRFGDQTWYEDVATQLVRTQHDDGSWGGLYETCFGVLALLHGRTPVLINKLEYGDGDAWNTSPRDAANLTRWFTERDGLPLTWQVIRLGEDRVDVYDAPILLITGHDKPDLSAVELENLRDYVHAGGSVLAVACCSRPAFTEGCKDLFQGLFPDFASGPLPESHPVWTMHGDPVKPGDDCIGMGDGCRTSVFILNNAACCAWTQDLRKRESRRFALGGNIIRYVMWNRSLRGRLAPYIRVTESASLRSLQVARLRHNGDWWVDPDALKLLSRATARHQGLELEEAAPVDTTNLAGAGVNVLWLTGHSLGLSSPNVRGELADFLQSGGTLIASARCGSESFDRSIHQLVADLYGPAAMKRIDPSDPLMSGAFAPDLAGSLQNMSYRERYGANPPPRLDWPILHGVWDQGRWVIVYSPYDLSAGISGQNCLDCLGYVPRDAQTVAANIMLYVAQQDALATRYVPPNPAAKP